MCYNSSLKEAKQVRKPYPTDLTDTQWKEIAPHYSGMRNRKWSKRELTNAVLHIVKTGCQWRQLPHDFPPYQTVYSFFSRGAKSGLWKMQAIAARLSPKYRSSASAGWTFPRKSSLMSGKNFRGAGLSNAPLAG